MGLDTSCSNECLVPKLQTFHAKFGVKIVMNEEIPVNEWQKKIKNVKVGRNDVYSIKFWVRLKCFLVYVFPRLFFLLTNFKIALIDKDTIIISFMVHPAHQKGSRNQL